jgi:hypothetical protein
VNGRNQRFTLVALLLATMLTSSLAAGPAVAEAVDQVRDVGVSWVAFAAFSAGPVQLAPGGSALARLWLPAGQQPARLAFLGDGGKVLGQVEIETPAAAGALFEVVVEATYDGGALRIADVTDGTSNTILFAEGSQGIIAVLIGLLRAGGPQGRAAMPRGMATLQISGPGQPFLLLPFIEQDN